MLDPFTRARRRAHARGVTPSGFGLGLTFARLVAQVHGGAITIEPAEIVGGVERGCRVVLSLPVGETA